MKAHPLPFGAQQRPSFAPQGAKKALQLLQRGHARQQAGKLKEAEYFYQLVLRDNPDHPEALNLLGTLASKAKNHGVAIECLTKAVEAQPKNVFYRNNLGYCLNAAHKAREALPHFQKAIAANPRMVEPLVGLGSAHRLLGEGEEAEKILRRAMQLAPEKTRIRSTLAEVLIDLGKIKEAAEIFRSILAGDPKNIPAIVGLASAREAGGEEGDLERFEYALKDQSLEAEKRVALHSALGQIYDQMKKPQEAFPHFIKSNELDKSDFNLTSFRRQIDDIIELFTPFFFLSKNGFGSSSERPLLVVGMPRSGTTLTEQMIASHGRAGGAGELARVGLFANRLFFSPQKDIGKFIPALDALGAKGVREMGENYIDLLKFHAPKAERVVDKMPHNFQHLGFVALMCPNARIIHCSRNPADTCWSCFQNPLNDSHSYSRGLTRLGLYYREYKRLMDHWKAVLPVPIYELSYERLTADFETEARKVIDFLGLPWDEACLNFHTAGRTVRTFSRAQVRNPIYQSSVERWRRYEKELQPLITALGDLV
jgi:tetratricopeptide (TPR) repeat protein